MSLSARYKLFWAGATAALFGLAYWKNTVSYPAMKWYNRLLKTGIDTTLVVAMAVWAPALLIMYVVMWLLSPTKNRVAQIGGGFGAMLVMSHVAGVVFEAVVILGVFAVDLITGQVLARTKRHLTEEVKVTMKGKNHEQTERAA